MAPKNHRRFLGMPLNVSLDTRHPRNEMCFAVHAPGDGVNRVSVFEHIRGSRVGEKLYPQHALPNGHRCFIYDVGAQCIEECEVDKAR